MIMSIKLLWTLNIPVMTPIKVPSWVNKLREKLEGEKCVK
jgi:hypothetical protein